MGHYQLQGRTAYDSDSLIILTNNLLQMLEFGVEEKWPSRHCARKWADMAPQHLHQTPQQHTPSSQQHTPTPHYATMAENFANYSYALSL